MAVKKKQKQSKRFMETARQLGADGSERAFERAFREIVPPKRPTSQRKKPNVPRDSEPPKSG